MTIFYIEYSVCLVLKYKKFGYAKHPTTREGNQYTQSFELSLRITSTLTIKYLAYLMFMMLIVSDLWKYWSKRKHPNTCYK
jgi:hypothetical protein